MSPGSGFRRKRAKFTLKQKNAVLIVVMVILWQVILLVQQEKPSVL